MVTAVVVRLVATVIMMPAMIRGICINVFIITGF